MRLGYAITTVIPAALLAACGSGETGQPNSSALVPVPIIAPPIEGPTAFNAGHRCVVMRAGDAYVRRTGSPPVVGLTTSGATLANAERFYLQPAGLARYVFYTTDALYVTANAPAVSLTAEPADGSDWLFAMPSTGVYEASVFDPAATGGDSGDRLTVQAQSGLLQVGSAATPLRFEGATGCTPYPEMPTAIGVRAADGTLLPTTFTGPAAGQPVIGIAEVHAHMSMGSDMSDGSGDRGPSAGGVMYGHAVNRFGVVEALKDCAEMHGENGSSDPEAAVLDGEPGKTHDTQGWPTFVDWPAKDSQLHQQMYYRFVERTYRAGLRLMVVHGTNIEALCDVAKNSRGDKTAECRDMDVGLLQVAYLTDIQNYVDAHHGGAGRGWFRIVKTPGEARQVIAQGKLAVVPGLEFSNIFHCNLTYTPEGGEIHGCTKEDIDREIEQAWEAGVRGVFPFHDVDSALGGTGIFSATLNFVNYAGTKGYWKTYDCPNGGDDPEYYFFDAGAVMTTAFPDGAEENPIGAALLAAQGTVPAYPPGRQCNAREVTDLGQYAIQAIMKKGFVLDIDHGSLKMKDYILGIADDTDPAYPTISAHGGHGGITWDQARNMLDNGGIIYPDMKNGREWKEFIDKVATIWPVDRPLAVGYGADQNGLADQPEPRATPRVDVTYPFTLFRGPGWGSQFGNLPALEVDLLRVNAPEGQFWNIDEKGVAHYGMIPDVIAELVIESGGDPKYTSALYNSAEAYLRLWEQTLEASAKRAAPAPAP